MKGIPQNIEAEVAVLAALLDFPDRIEQVAEVLKPTDFYRDNHRTVYEAMLTYWKKHGKGPDFLVLCDVLEQSGKLEEVGGASELTLLVDNRWSMDFAADVNLILGPSAQRQNIIAGQKLAQIGFSISDPAKAREAVEKLLYDLTMDHAPTSDFDSLSDILSGYVEDVEHAIKNRGTPIGITTGFTDLDLLTQRFQRSDLILLAARPSMGKTALGMNIGYNAARKGHAVAVFSLEMAKKQLGARLLSLHSGIPTNTMRAGWLDDEGLQKVVESEVELSKLCIHIDDTVGSPISSIRSKLRRLKSKIGRPLDLVVVDYLGLMVGEEDSAARKENRNQEISEISRGLKAIAREFDVPMLALAQLSRAVEGRQSKIPQLSDLRDSGSLEQDADVVMFIYRDEYYAGYDEFGKSKSDRAGEADVIVAKHRNGPVGEIRLGFNGALTRFYNLDLTVSEEGE